MLELPSEDSRCSMWLFNGAAIFLATGVAASIYHQSDSGLKISFNA